MSHTRLCLLLAIASLVFTQNAVAVSPLGPKASASTAPVQVVYMVEGATILTYDVDPQTLTATQVALRIFGGTYEPSLMASLLLR